MEKEKISIKSQSNIIDGKLYQYTQGNISIIAKAIKQADDLNELVVYKFLVVLSDYKLINVGQTYEWYIRGFVEL